MLRSSWLGLALVFVAPGLLDLACQRKDAPSPASQAASSASSAKPAIAPPPNAAPSASAAAPKPKHPAEIFLMAWSAALDHHAVAELASFYGPEVIFYGRRETLAKVVAAKRQALEKAPKFRQSITDVHVQNGPNGFVLRFQKLSGDGVMTAVAARLVLEASKGKLAIVEESDAPTDKRTASPAATTCSQVVNQIVGSHPVIAADVTRVAREYPEVHPGGFYYDEVEHPDRVSLSQGYFHEDHYEARWWIDAADGVLTIRDAYTTALLVVTRNSRRPFVSFVRAKPTTKTQRPATDRLSAYASTLGTVTLAGARPRRFRRPLTTPIAAKLHKSPVAQPAGDVF
jgi:hypothetical protein